MKCEVFLSKNTDDWATPKYIYEQAMAKTEKSKAEVYRSLKENGGSDLIIKLASMPKEEREKAIADYLK